MCFLTARSSDLSLPRLRHSVSVRVDVLRRMAETSGGTASMTYAILNGQFHNTRNELCSRIHMLSDALTYKNVGHSVSHNFIHSVNENTGLVLTKLMQWEEG